MEATHDLNQCEKQSIVSRWGHDFSMHCRPGDTGGLSFENRGIGRNGIELVWGGGGQERKTVGQGRVSYRG
jgi:hypothetical protein